MCVTVFAALFAPVDVFSVVGLLSMHAQHRATCKNRTKWNENRSTQLEVFTTSMTVKNTPKIKTKHEIFAFWEHLQLDKNLI